MRGGLVCCESDGVVYFLGREALCLEELDALLEGCVLCLWTVSGAGEEVEGLAFGSDRNATAFLRRSCLSMKPLDSHSAPGIIFCTTSCSFLAMFRLRALLRPSIGPSLFLLLLPPLPPFQSREPRLGAARRYGDPLRHRPSHHFPLVGLFSCAWFSSLTHTS